MTPADIRRRNAIKCTARIKTALLWLLLGLSLLTTGCECVAGFGRDVQHTGRWLEETSNEVRQR